jgi:hypothetical protein
MQKSVFPQDIAFPPSHGVSVSVNKGAFAGSAMYQINYGHIASDNEEKEIHGWCFLFEPAITVVTKGIVYPSAGEHILILVAESGKFKDFRKDNIFKCTETDEMTILLKNLLEKNVESYPNNKQNKKLLTGLLENLTSYEYIIVLKNINDLYPTPSSTLGNQEDPKKYAEYIVKMIQRQERRKQFLEEQSKETQTQTQTQTKRPRLSSEKESQKSEKESQKSEGKKKGKSEGKKKGNSKGKRKGGTKKNKRKTVSKKR